MPNALTKNFVIINQWQVNYIHLQNFKKSHLVQIFHYQNASCAQYSRFGSSSNIFSISMMPCEDWPRSRGLETRENCWLHALHQSYQDLMGKTWVCSGPKL